MSFTGFSLRLSSRLCDIVYIILVLWWILATVLNTLTNQVDFFTISPFLSYTIVSITMDAKATRNTI